MVAGARRVSGGRVARAAHGHERPDGTPANSRGVYLSGGPRLRRHRTTPALVIAVAMMLLGGAGAGSAADVDQGENGGAGLRRLDRGPSRMGDETGRVPWRAVPVELKVTPRKRRRRRGLGSPSSMASAGGTTATPKRTPELLPSYKYVMTPESATPTPDAATVPDAISTKQITPTTKQATAATATEAEAATTAAAADTSTEGRTLSARPSSPEKTGAGSVTGGGGGEFGISADWLYAISMPGGEGEDASLRDEACLVEDKQEDVHEILRRRNGTPAGSKVAVCVRTKDFGRFLPEWIAYHYAIGVDEMTIFDDDSIDDTKEVLQPFVDAGMVLYLFEEIGYMENQMSPLNHCLYRYIERREEDPSAPAWILFHDTDEYIFPVQTNVTISEALTVHSPTCCLHVPRVQYGTNGYRQMPRGLVLETFLTHASPHKVLANRNPKVVVNLAPDDPSLGKVIPPLKSMHNARGCECEDIPVTEIRINHYLGSTEDYLERTKRSWQAGYSHEKAELFVEQRDINDETSDTITTWACATREVLFRVVEGMDLESGLE